MGDESAAKETGGLRELALEQAPCLPMLPLMHMTGAVYFEAIRSQGNLQARDCSVFEQPLVYLFYGRPAFRPFASEGPSSIHDLRPICIILHPQAVSEIARVAAIDTGAFDRGFYDRHIGPGVALADFELGTDLEVAARFVRAVFGSNKAYYLGKLHDLLKPGPLNFVGQAYRSIISDRGRTLSDGRRSAIEVQSSTDIPIGAESVMAVVVPEDFLEEEELREMLKSWDCDIIPYDLYGDSPLSDAREVMVHVKGYLDKKGYFVG